MAADGARAAESSVDQVTQVATAHRPASFSYREMLMLAALMVPSAVTLIDSGMLSVALPIIQNEFGVPVDVLSWAVAAAFLSQVALMPIFGRVGDLMGKKRLYLIGFAIFTMGAGLNVVAPSFGWLVAGRLLQGVGGASMPLAMALIVDAFGQERRGRALGIWNSAAPAGIILGPVLGGLVVESLGWHANFAIITATSLLSLLLVAWLIPASEPLEQESNFDWTGATALVAAAASLLLATTTASVIPLGSPVNLIFWDVAALALLALFWNARRGSDPFIGGDVVRNRRFMLPAVAVNLRMFAHDGGRFLMVLYLANVFGQSPRMVGLFMLFYTAPLLIGVVYGGFIADRWPTRTAGAVNMFIQAASMLWLGLAGPDAGDLILAPGMILAGAGSGASLIPFTKEALVALGQKRVGLAAGLYNTMRFAGSAAATPLLGLLLAYGFAQEGGLETASGPYRLGFQLLALVAALGIVVAAFIPGDGTETERIAT